MLLVGLGQVPRQLLADAGAELARVYSMKAALLPSQDRPKYALNEARSQYHTAAVLRRLSHLGSGGAPVVGITDVDLFVPDAPFVLGDADREGNSAIVSTARLHHGPAGGDVDADRLKRRVLVEAVHQMGLLLGLAQCSDSRCAMYVSHRPSDADRKGPGVCASCRAALGLP